MRLTKELMDNLAYERYLMSIWYKDATILSAARAGFDLAVSRSFGGVKAAEKVAGRMGKMKDVFSEKTKK